MELKTVLIYVQYSVIDQKKRVMKEKSIQLYHGYTNVRQMVINNYKPISLFSHVYKLFPRVISNPLARRFDEFQPPEEAAFEKGYSNIDHIHAVRQIIQKT